MKELEIIPLGSTPGGNARAFSSYAFDFSIDMPVTLSATLPESVGVSAHSYIHPFIYLPCAFHTALLKTLLIPTSLRFIATGVSFVFQRIESEEGEREKERREKKKRFVQKTS